MINRAMTIVPVVIIVILASASPSFREVFKHGLPSFLMSAIPASASRGGTTSGDLAIELFDGTRHRLSSFAGVSFQLYDGLQRLVKEGQADSSTISVAGLATNLVENRYTLIMSVDGGTSVSITPIHVAPASLTKMHAMVVRRNDGYDLGRVEEELSPRVRPQMARLFAGEKRESLGRFEREQAEVAAGLLNMTTALDEFRWKDTSLLSYFQSISLENARRDRFFAWVDKHLIDVMEELAANGQSQHIPMSWTFHPGATTSYKEVRLSEANLQVTFYESKRSVEGGKDCVYAEVDIDYYRDPIAHFFCEVVPHWFNHGTADPRVVYQMRWTECANKGLSFDPPYVLRDTSGSGRNGE